ncbi:hypothetical protein [Embleya sp. AB8]|uniref:WXG100-like domain-containing protein n=1 Tax=Embleya sp. AB8 TaxID=3156304 RepID=UPI003C72932E
MGIFGDAADLLEDGLDKAGEAVDAGLDKAGEAVDFVVDLAEAGLDECMRVLKGLVSLGDEAVEQVVRFLGLPWPKADEDKLRELAGGYERLAAVLDQVIAGASGPARGIIARNTGLPIDNFAAFWSQYEGSGRNWLPSTAASCREQAASLRKLADAVQTQKTVLKAEILAVAATILVGAGLLVVPGVNIISGAAMSAATFAAESAATACGLAISASVLEIIGTIVGSAVIGAVTSVALDLAVAQPIKIAMGAQHGLTTDHLLETAAYGAAGGAVGGTMSAGAQQLPKLVLPTRLSALTALTAKAPAALNSVTGQALAGGGTAAIIDATTQGKVSLLDVLAGTAGGAAGGRASQATARPGSRPSITDVLDGTPSRIDMGTRRQQAELHSRTSRTPVPPEVPGDAALRTGEPIYYRPEASAIGGDPATRGNYGRAGNVPGLHDVVVHGNEEGFFGPTHRRTDGSYFSNETNPTHIVEAIINNPDYAGGPVRLISCHSGADAIGSPHGPAAQEVARQLGVPVHAPTDLIALDAKGNPVIANGGYFRIFLPIIS